MRIKIGTATSHKSKLYNVHWDDKTREVWVELPSAFGGGAFSKCPAKAERAEDAMHIAHAFLHDK